MREQRSSPDALMITRLRKALNVDGHRTQND